MSDRVLLIDDDPRLVAVLLIRLEALGYEVHIALGGEEGLAAAWRTRPNVMVVDINMPRIDGIQVCRATRQDPVLNATPIVVLSAVTHDAARKAALDAGANQFVGKPYQATQVISAIRTAIESGRMTGITSDA